MRIFRTVSSITAVIFLSVSPTLSATEKRGVIDGDERWTAEGSPYVLTDDIFVTKKGRLTISPGVRVIVEKPFAYDKAFEQLDHLDSFTVSIRVQGAFTCVGRADNRISIRGGESDATQCDWYGIVLEGASKSFTEIAFTDIAGACHGLTMRECAPLIRNTVFEYNNVAISCDSASTPRIFNSVVAHNFATGIRVYKSNPTIRNNIIAFNRNTGMWCDGISLVVFEHNCVYGNTDGNLLGCDPEFGVLTKKNQRGDSTDAHYNLYTDPIFQKTKAESLAVERDVSRPTDKSRMRDTTLAKILYDTLVDSGAAKYVSGAAKRYSLSTYSPCIDAGKKGKPYRDTDGSRNDIGLYGGPEFFERE